MLRLYYLIEWVQVVKNDIIKKKLKTISKMTIFIVNIQFWYEKLEIILTDVRLTKKIA